MNWQIAIDGPAGAGKSTIAKEVAKKLNFCYFDTGSMYRAITLKALNLKINKEDEAEYKFLEQTKIDLDGDKIYLDGVEVTKDIRSLEVTNNVSLVSKFKYVRDILVDWQRKLVDSKNIIMDGRDIGTVVLPNAHLKIFLVASVEERAARRLKERLDNGYEASSLEETINEIIQRDNKDSNRAISPLAKATDAIEIDTSELSVNEVVEKIISLVMERGYKMENVKTNKNVEAIVEETTEKTTPEVKEETVLVETKEEVAVEAKEEVAVETKEETAIETKEEVVAEPKEEVVVEEKQEEVVEEETVRELQLVEGEVIEVLEATKEEKKGNYTIKAKEERVLVKLENGQEGLLFRKDVAGLKDDEELMDLFIEGDKLKVVVKRVYNDGGKVLLSTALVEKREEIEKFEDVIKNHGTIKAKVVKNIKVGLILEHEGYTCLLPNSQVDFEGEDFSSLVGQEIAVAPIRVDYNRIRLIVSQRVANAIISREEKQEFIKTVEVGQEFDGVVKNIEVYGAFVEVAPGVEGLLHISEIEHNRIVKVEKVLNIGDSVKVKVIKVDKDHIGLSRKALLPNFWKEFIDSHNVNDLIKGTIIEINKAGVVISFNDEIQGFLPKSEFSWERTTVIEDVVKVSEEIEVKIIELDLNKKRIILSRKQLAANPWETLKLKSNDPVKAKVLEVTDQGIRVDVEGAFGFMPKNNYSQGTVFTVGQEIEAKVRVFDRTKTRLIVTMREENSFDKQSINKYLKSQERVTSTLGDFFDSEDLGKK
ncbi:MAG: (d)CMP kinase [Bacilli bacterium]